MESKTRARYYVSEDKMASRMSLVKGRGADE